MIGRLKKFPEFLKEVKEELKKVNWSTRQQLLAAAVIVVVVAAVLTTYIFFIDIGLSRLVQFLLQ
ncbi:MAG: preprotein translocase subunit SecE [Candidatus Omnitrophota bacterium]|nr:MAG: preprotein translocase subunit SecE [Candidatus Omnitrophota bacterium]